MWEFNQSLRYDKRMYAQDVRGSKAYAKALCLKGLLSEEERDRIVEGLERVEGEWREGVVSIFFVFDFSVFEWERGFEREEEGRMLITSFI